MHFHKKSVKWALAPTLAVTMLFSTMGIATMTAATDPRDQPDTQAFHRPITTDSALSATTVSQPALVVTGPSVQADEELQEELFLEDDFTVTMPIWSDAPTPVDTEIDASELNSLMALMASGAVPSYEEAFNAMNALKSQAAYSEGTLWNNFTPYGRDSDKDAYWFQGGSVKGARGGVGCAAFVFILSDAAFGNLPARTIDNGGFTYDQIKVGDILRVNNSHFVIVMEKSAGGVIVAEGNYNSSVHWGRAISKAEVMAANFIVTRYPDGYVDPSDGAADTVEKSGTENDLKWTLTKAGILTISGNGAIPDYNPNENIMPSWNTETFNTVIIEDGVTSIGDYAFYQKASLLSAQLPDSITKIGNSAFRETDLIGITIPKGVTSIGDDAFHKCSNLTSATFNEGLTTIGQRAFQGCTKLTYADFPTTITSVGAGAFFDCTNIVSVRFKPGTGDVHMGDDIFRNCQHLMTVVLPQKLTAISPGMFASCKILSTLYIPASVTKVGAEAGDLAQSPFESAGILQLNFGGSEDAWKSMVNATINGSFQQYGTKISYNVPFTDPFAKDPNDPGDLIPDDTGENPPTDPTPGEHQHNWAAEWSHNADYHWHACSAENCTVAEDSQKDGVKELKIEYRLNTMVIQHIITEIGSLIPGQLLLKQEASIAIATTADISRQKAFRLPAAPAVLAVPGIRAVPAVPGIQAVPEIRAERADLILLPLLLKIPTTTRILPRTLTPTVPTIPEMQKIQVRFLHQRLNQTTIPIRTSHKLLSRKQITLQLLPTNRKNS